MFRVGDKVKLKESHRSYFDYSDVEFTVIYITTDNDLFAIQFPDSDETISTLADEVEFTRKRIPLTCRHCDLYMEEYDLISCPECGKQMTWSANGIRR